MKIVAAATAVALAGTCASVEMQATTRKREKSKNKKELLQENKILKDSLEQMKLRLEKCEEQLAATNHVAEELAGIYEEPDTLGPETIEYTAEVSDSLYNAWILQKMVTEDDLPKYNMDSVRFESNVPDSVYIERICKMSSFITLPYNDIVKNYIILYSEKMHKNMPKVLGLAEYYMPIFEEIFNRYGMPEELKAMAVIESMLNPTAESRAGAKGMWQFMYGTAKLYGLTINSFVDERLDPVKSCEAAARYLKDSYEIFGDWNLAIASYNCGAGNVNKAIRRSGGKRAFWDIYPYLPRETRGYVPAFVGALYTMRYYKEHGIEPVSTGLPAAVDTFKINKMLHFKQLSEYAGIPHDQVKNLNPQYRHDIVPGNEKEYILRIPYQYSSDFVDHEDSLYSYKADMFFNPVTIKKIKDGGDGQRIIYRVKSGDVLGKIALRNRCSVSQIKRWNNLKSNNIRVGQRLVLYRGGSGAPVSTSSSSSTKKSSTAATSTKNVTKKQTSRPVDKNAAYTWYTIKSGESLYMIAKRYPGVSAQNIMDFNGISTNVKPGMKIKIPEI